MWITNYIAKEKKDRNIVGSITNNNGTDFSVMGSSQHKNAKVAYPYGFYYNPPVDETAIVIPTEKGSVMTGVCCEVVKDLEPGEIMIKSQGGATILLDNRGRVIINGKVFS